MGGSTDLHIGIVCVPELRDTAARPVLDHVAKGRGPCCLEWGAVGGRGGEMGSFGCGVVGVGHHWVLRLAQEEGHCAGLVLHDGSPLWRGFPPGQVQLRGGPLLTDVSVCCTFLEVFMSRINFI